MFSDNLTPTFFAHTQIVSRRLMSTFSPKLSTLIRRSLPNKGLYLFYLEPEMTDNHDFSPFKRAFKPVIALLAALLVVSTVAQAQIFECNGTWTNQPCPGATPVMTEVATDSRPFDNSLRHKKELLHTLTTARYQAKDNYGFDMDSSGVERYCELDSTAIKDCQERIDSFLGKLDTRIVEEKRLDLQRREVELAEQKRVDGVSGTTNIVVVQGGVISPTPSHRWPFPRGTYHPITPPERFSPPQMPAPSRNEVKNDARAPLPR